MPVSTLGPKGGGFGGGPTSIGGRKECQRGRWAPKGVDLGAVLHRLEEGKSASEDVGPQRGWIWGRSHIDWRKERVPTRTLGPEEGWIWGWSHIDWRKEKVPARTLGPKGGWIVMSHIGWGGEQIIIYKGVETFSQHTRFKALRTSPKRTVSASDGSESLQMVSEPDTGRCVSLPQRGVDTRRCAKTLGPEGGWIVMSQIGWGGEQIIIYKGVESLKRTIWTIFASGGSGSLHL